MDDSALSPNTTPPAPRGGEREGAALREHLRAALAGHGRLVLTGGEAGKKAAAWVREHVGSSIESVERHEGESVWDVRAG
jgi:hypothetical protein